MKEGERELREKLLSTEYLYRGKIVNLRRDRVLTPGGGKAALREVVEHPGAVAILALDREKRLVLVRQYRQAVGRILWEIPAGKLEEGEEPLQCAQRELAEETGCRGGKWRELTWVYSSPGFCNEKIYLYLAEDVIAEGAFEPDDDEVLEPRWFHREEIRALAGRGQICDAKTALSLHLTGILTS